MTDSTTEWISRQNTPTVVSGIATMDLNATKTAAIPSGGRSVIRIGVPAIDSSTLTFEVQPFPTNNEATGTFRTLKDAAGNAVTVTASTGNFVVDIPELSGAYAFKIVTAAQTSLARLFEVQCVGLHPASTSSSGSGGGAVTQGTSPWVVSGGGTALAPASGVVTVQRPSITQVISTALEASHVLKASAGQLVELSVFNSKSSAQFILLINATSLPSNGAVTLLYPPIPIAAATLLVIDLPAPLVASTGIVVANSSTGTFSLTVGSNDCVFYAQVN